MHRVDNNCRKFVVTGLENRLVWAGADQKSSPGKAGELDIAVGLNSVSKLSAITERRRVIE